MERSLQFKITAPVDYKYLKMAKGFGRLQYLLLGKTAILPSVCFQIFIIGLDLLPLGNVNNKSTKLPFVRRVLSDPLLTGKHITPRKNTAAYILCDTDAIWIQN